jgi:Leucine rich repeat/Leucine Rich Repeat
VGTLPEELATLSHLESLSLRHNELSGHLPSSLIQLTALTLLDVTDNRLVSKLPPSLSRLSHLQVLRLGQNELTGEWGHQLFDLGQLRELNVSWNNGFTGPIWGFNVASWNGNHNGGSLSYLEILDVSNCAFEGQINGDPITAMTNLREFHFGGNLLTGLFPTSYWPPSLSILRGPNNQLTGSFPWIAFDAVTNLRHLDVSHNLLTSILPTTTTMEEDEGGESTSHRKQYSTAVTLEYLDGSNNLLLQASLLESIGQWTAGRP